MPIKFGQPSKKVHFLQILIPQPGMIYYVNIGHDPKFHRETDLHYLVDENRSVPCMHEDCRYHHLPARPVVYVPAAVFVDPKVLFQPTILMLTDAWRNLLEQDLKKWLFAIKRKGASNSPVVWSQHRELSSDVVPYEGVNIVASLFRAWGYKSASPVEQGNLYE